MAKSKKKTVQREEKVNRSMPSEVRERRDQVDESDNRSFIGKIVIVVLVLIGLYLIVSFIADQRNDNSEKSKDDKTSQVKKDDKETDDDDATDVDSETQDNDNGTRVEETDKQFTFTVGSGESYTTIARQASADTDSKLTHAERVAAETKLVSEAGAEWLNEGQSLALTKDAVKAAIDWAKGLSDADKAAWQPYADLIAW